MTKYDFTTLSDHDFELLTRDLLQLELQITLESFKKGRDGGIDLRYSIDKNKSLIIQCKHYAKSSYSNLKTSLKNELQKVKELAPSRYLIVTSLGLTPMNKDEIIEIFAPYIGSTADIYGADDINNMIGKFPEVEQRHLMLWANSINQFQNVLKMDEINRSNFFIENIVEKARRFVMFSTYDKALEQLEKNHFCIIAGQPGVGKTTLAEILALRYLKEGYEPIKVTRSVNQINSMYKNAGEQKQFFVFDDFLGQSNLRDTFSDNEEDDLSLLLSKIQKSSEKRLVITSRDYILKDALLKNEKLARSVLKKSEYVLNMNELNAVERTKLVCSYLEDTQLDKHSIESVIENGTFIPVIQHPNFNPRILEYTTKQLATNNLSEIINKLTECFENPKEVWDLAFKHIPSQTRDLLFVLASMPSEVLLSDLQLAYNAFRSQYAKLEEWEDSFIEKLEALEHVFIDIEVIVQVGKQNIRIVKFQNPSIFDYLKHKILNSNELIEKICKNAIYIEQLIFMSRLLSRESFNSQYSYLIKGYERTIDADSVDLQVIREKNNSYISKRKHSINEKFIYIFKDIGKMPVNKVTQKFKRDMLTKLKEELSDCHDYFNNLYPLYHELLIGNKNLTDEILDLIPIFKNILLKKLDRIDEFEFITALKNDYTDLERSFIRERLLTVIEKDVSNYSNGYVEVDQIYEYIEKIKKMSKKFNVNVKNKIKTLNDKIKQTDFHFSDVCNYIDFYFDEQTSATTFIEYNLYEMDKVYIESKEIEADDLLEIESLLTDLLDH
ncbi:hypothetical protein QD46_17870 [Paenibacillus polymyxa]|uniref:nSTAND3 domain-containing NTPase n=1 Tax=Paenibacillus polymyxa TaxID=1406 RepID=UPI0005CF5FE1|nr:restriction endonuclease [Paenibacillus polymyxa]KJD38694.1 hypothetical protein QD46_17870 [Paenibacillus polymyxa]MBY7740158.1 restriction endonuclease [Paenibacillus polymyxa]